jgi:hypothetical protein
LTRNHEWTWRFALSIAASVILVGCGKNDRPPLAKAGGIVLFQGKPLPAGRISFIPDRSRGTAGRGASGIIGPDGRFTLQSYADGDGALVGFHLVAIESWEEVATPSVSRSEDDLPARPPPLKSRIPGRYNDHATSDLAVEVKAGGSNDFELTVESR